MTMQVSQPKRSAGGLGPLSSVINIGAGIASLSTPAAPAGAAMLAGEGLKQKAKTDQASQDITDNALTRRSNIIKMDDASVLKSLHAGEQALNNLKESNPDIAALYGPPLLQTILEASKRYQAGQPINPYQQGPVGPTWRQSP